jgi:3-mercaptopropionate dioxygenase
MLRSVFDGGAVYLSEDTRHDQPAAIGRPCRRGQSQCCADSAPGLAALAAAVRAAVAKRVDWRDTAQLVASALARHLPSPRILTAEQRTGDPEGYKSEVLYAEPDGSFSIVALVWRPGQVTPIHDHVTWCVFGVIQGMECEELFELDEQGACLVEAGHRVNRTGDVSGFAPPGDIHRVRNAGDLTAISIHIYGTDVSRIGSSVRRYYDLRVRPSRPAA